MQRLESLRTERMALNAEYKQLMNGPLGRGWHEEELHRLYANYKDRLFGGMHLEDYDMVMVAMECSVHHKVQPEVLLDVASLHVDVEALEANIIHHSTSATTVALARGLVAKLRKRGASLRASVSDMHHHQAAAVEIHTDSEAPAMASQQATPEKVKPPPRARKLPIAIELADSSAGEATPAPPPAPAQKSAIDEIFATKPTPPPAPKDEEEEKPKSKKVKRKKPQDELPATTTDAESEKESKKSSKKAEPVAAVAAPPAPVPAEEKHEEVKSDKEEDDAAKAEAKKRARRAQQAREYRAKKKAVHTVTPAAEASEEKEKEPEAKTKRQKKQTETPGAVPQPPPSPMAVDKPETPEAPATPAAEKPKTPVAAVVAEKPKTPVVVAEKPKPPTAPAKKLDLSATEEKVIPAPAVTIIKRPASNPIQRVCGAIRNPATQTIDFRILKLGMTESGSPAEYLKATEVDRGMSMQFLESFRTALHHAPRDYYLSSSAPKPTILGIHLHPRAGNAIDRQIHLDFRAGSTVRRLESGPVPNAIQPIEQFLADAKKTLDIKSAPVPVTMDDIEDI